MKDQVYEIYVPEFVLSEQYAGYRCKKHVLPDGIFCSKEYPICNCGRKYVPIKGQEKDKCFFCIFTKPSERTIIKPEVTTYKKVNREAYCQYCSRYIPDLTPQKSGNTCPLCTLELRKKSNKEYRDKMKQIYN